MMNAEYNSIKSTKFPSGLPTISDYETVGNDDEFKAMKIFSEKFLEKNKNNLKYYIKKWAKDPLHSWSRRWEYPYVFNQVSPCVRLVVASKI
jgi:hypothetical protein